jgi:hypothetical protein
MSSRQRLALYNSYGRGAEIWPERNEDPVQLADSFPNGQVPFSAVLRMEETDMAAIHQRVGEVVKREGEQDKQRRRKRKMVSKTIRRILRRAAAKEELESEATPAARIDKTPIIIAIGLLARGLVQPLDALLVIFLTGYFIMLSLVARSTRENSEAPILPAIPPQGHVPAMVSNPLGTGFLYSKLYDLWLQVGVVTGLVGPLVLLGRYLYVHNNMVAARLCASPIFLLCCQAISEALSRRVMVSTVWKGSRYVFMLIVDVSSCWIRTFFFLLSFIRLHFLSAFWYPSPTIQLGWAVFGIGLCMRNRLDCLVESWPLPMLFTGLPIYFAFYCLLRRFGICERTFLVSKPKK